MDRHGAVRARGVDAVRGKRRERQRDVARARRLVGESNLDPARGPRRDQHQRGDELARRGAADLDPAAIERLALARTFDDDRQRARHPRKLGARADRAQEVDAFVDRTLAHARAAVDLGASRGKRRHREHEARRGAAVAEIDARRRARTPGDAAHAQDRRIGRVPRELRAHRAERVDEPVAIVRSQRARQPRLAVGKRRDHQVAVGQALRAGHADPRAQAIARRTHHAGDLARRARRISICQDGSRRSTATTSSTGITKRRLSPSKSTGIACFGLKSTRSYCLIG